MFYFWFENSCSNRQVIFHKRGTKSPWKLQIHAGMCRSLANLHNSSLLCLQPIRLGIDIYPSPERTILARLKDETVWVRGWLYPCCTCSGLQGPDTPSEFGYFILVVDSLVKRSSRSTQLTQSVGSFTGSIIPFSCMLSSSAVEQLTQVYLFRLSVFSKPLISIDCKKIRSIIIVFTCSFLVLVRSLIASYFGGTFYSDVYTYICGIESK